MPSSFGQWLIVILALALGGAAGWLARGRQSAAAAPSAPIVEGDPVVGLTEVEKAEATTATLDTPRPEATVDHSPAPAAVVDEPAGHDLTVAPAAATLTTATTDEPVSTGADGTPADHRSAAEEPAAPARDAREAADDTPRATPEQDEPVRADAESGTPLTADPTPQPADAPDSVTAEVDGPAEKATPAIPAPRAAADDTAPVADGDDLASTTSTAAASTPEPATAPAAEPAAAPAVAEPVVAAGPAVADEETADDFRRIQGVGPKMAAALQAAGIRTYRQLAELDEAALRETIRAAGLRTAASLATWPQQAKVLAGAGAEADAVLPVPTGAGEQG
ncbi:DUF4332 domain-containing protein [Micromonospora coxensis]|uniref:Helix-hairpin-helix domain-containing protein n=1 Tax=Micromonospora coxensis TaxID=356852 RepID=A0A1C5H9X2_9ACTN|nr:DUF4332 domain-containing protein [Micromonospora coxensis]SCG42271.1 Helix-hairpin-helix domain-containing protein [Micromonospora coxensis]